MLKIARKVRAIKPVRAACHIDWLHLPFLQIKIKIIAQTFDLATTAVPPGGDLSGGRGRAERDLQVGRELQLVDVQDGIDDVFEEISRLASECRFADCTHESEPGCAVLAAVESGDVDPDRLKRWHKLIREEAMNRESIAERRARGKALGKFYKSTLSDSLARKGRS